METVWTFKTRNFTVALELEPEDMDPADSFEREDDIQAVRSGAVDWFQARVVVYGPDGKELGADSLGGCAYAPASDFWTAHRDRDPANRNTLATKAKGFVFCHYFPSMVSEAIADARRNVERNCALLRH